MDLLLALNVAKTLGDLSPLKSVGLHKLRGTRKSQWAMTVNELRGGFVSSFAKAMPMTSRSSIITEADGGLTMSPVAHPGRLLKRELVARGTGQWGALALDLGVPSGRRVTDILNARHARSRRIRPCGSAAISAMARNSGSICKANTISPSSSATAAGDRATRPSGRCGVTWRRDDAGGDGAYGLWRLTSRSTISAATLRVGMACAAAEAHRLGHRSPW